MHCSESLFGTLFICTVHEVLKKIKNNKIIIIIIKSNEIKSFKTKYSKINFFVEYDFKKKKLLSCITYECMDIVYKILRNVNSVSRLCLLLGDTALNINLSFDICRWLVEGEDVEGVHEVLVRHY